MRFAGLCAFLLAASCSTMNGARPLEPGEHAVGVTLGGPLIDVPNIGTLPMPHATIEGRHGIVHRFDVNYGLHVLPLVFGVAGAHVGGTFLLAPEKGGGLPALAVAQRVYGFTNRLDGRDPESARGDWFLSQTELTASWRVADQLFYGGLAGYVPILQPKPYLAPFVGVELRPFVDWARIQVEARWIAPYVNTRFGVVDWIAPGDQGAIVLNAGVAFVFDARDLFASEEP
jgi:hypothetical protein